MLSGGIGSIGKGSPYIPDWSTVLSTWLPNSLGTLDFSFTETSLGINLHLVWGAVDGLGAALLLRARGWLLLLGVLPLMYAVGHHALFNYTGGGSGGAGWAKTLFKFPDAVLDWARLVCLVLAMGLDYAAIRRGRGAMPAILLEAEREGRTGLAALGGFAAWRVPWSLLIALRFARMRRSLCYAAGRVPPDRLESLHAAVANTAARMNASNHQGAWETARVRSLLKSARRQRPWRRRWPLVVIPLILMTPSLLFLGVGLVHVHEGSPGVVHRRQRSSDPAVVRHRGPGLDGAAAGAPAARLAQGEAATAGRDRRADTAARVGGGGVDPDRGAAAVRPLSPGRAVGRGRHRPGSDAPGISGGP
ncbi:hypothetical protein AB0O76_19200 [Streptomyces sp. NPDC086554]|uniref:hypothetical protein n=1 Tax=Streptomyces sp. NPDC086554 TaxID=3154864 RepID=UPI00341DC9F4